MIAELVGLYRRVTRPLGRAYWWPGRSRDKKDAAGVILISFAQASEKTRHKLLKRYRGHLRHELLDELEAAGLEVYVWRPSDFDALHRVLAAVPVAEPEGDSPC